MIESHPFLAGLLIGGAALGVAWIAALAILSRLWDSVEEEFERYSDFNEPEGR